MKKELSPYIHDKQGKSYDAGYSLCKLYIYSVCKWANGEHGSIVDFNELKEDIDEKGKPLYDIGETYDEYHFVRSELNLENGLTESEEKSCPIVASGIVAYWIKQKNRSDHNNVRIFESYYKKMCDIYVDLQQCIYLDSWNKNYEDKFKNGVHLEEEKKRIETSKALLNYLQGNNKDTIIRLMEQYLEFVKSKATRIEKKTRKERKKKPSPIPRGKHKGFPFIRGNGPDPYRMAQVVDLYNFMKKSKADGGANLIHADQRHFINNFTDGTTSSTIIWLGTKRQLHYVVNQWKYRGYITFGSDDDIWVITSQVFLNGKGKAKNGKLTPFNSDDLGSTHDPIKIAQDLEEIVEMLNPEKPSPNYKKHANREEDRIGYSNKARSRESHQQGDEDDDPMGIKESYEEDIGNS